MMVDPSQPVPGERSAASSNGSYAIAAHDLNVYYGSFRAVKDISLKVRRHQITALIGPSGCGKSTLLRAFNRMNELIPSAHATGEVHFQGQNIYAPDIDPVEVRRRIGMVFQKANPFPKSIYENVAWGARINGFRGNMDELVEQSLRQAALWDEVKDKLQQSGLGLSGGQQQRLCIARAIAVRPEIILMDEPASALDPIATLKIEELMHYAGSRLHDHHRHAQHAAGGACLRLHGLPPHGQRPRRHDDRVRPDARAVHQTQGTAHRGLHHGAVRISADFAAMDENRTTEARRTRRRFFPLCFSVPSVPQGGFALSP